MALLSKTKDRFPKLNLVIDQIKTGEYVGKLEKVGDLEQTPNPGDPEIARKTGAPVLPAAAGVAGQPAS